MGRSYILFTPIKNEVRNLPNLISSILSQTIHPVLWIITNDGSTDGSSKILEGLDNRCSWVKIIKMPEGPRKIGFHYSEVVKACIDYAMEYCKVKKVDYNYLGVVDADISFDKNYFEYLINKFEKDPSLGIAGGGTYFKRGKKLIWDKTTSQWPTGGAMLVSSKCFNKTRWEISRSPDGVMFVKAMLNGFKTRNYRELVALQSRPTSTGDGYWNGFIDFGQTRYYLGYTPLFAIIYSVRLLFSYPFFHSIAFMVGYFSDCFKKKKRNDDKEILMFFRRRLKAKLKELFQYYRCKDE